MSSNDLSVDRYNLPRASNLKDRADPSTIISATQLPAESPGLMLVTLTVMGLGSFNSLIGYHQRPTK